METKLYAKLIDGQLITTCVPDDDPDTLALILADGFKPYDDSAPMPETDMLKSLAPTVAGAVAVSKPDLTTGINRGANVPVFDAGSKLDAGGVKVAGDLKAEADDLIFFFINPFHSCIADLTMGDGNGRPLGIVASAVASGATPAATAIKTDDLIDLVASVNSDYADVGKFMFNHTTFWSLVKLKDSMGRYIWQEEVRGSTPPAMFGKPYVVNDDMPGIGAGNASVLFGDFSKFKIRMVRDFRVIRLNELLSEYLSVGIFGFARADDILLDAGTNPVKKLVHPAS